MYFLFGCASMPKVQPPSAAGLHRNIPATTGYRYALHVGRELLVEFSLSLYAE
jgi:hypothetical protein